MGNYCCCLLLPCSAIKISIPTEKKMHTHVHARYLLTVSCYAYHLKSVCIVMSEACLRYLIVLCALFYSCKFFINCIVGYREGVFFFVQMVWKLFMNLQTFFSDENSVQKCTYSIWVM